MRILAFTDLHASLDGFDKLKRKIKKKKPDIIICAGDISIFENGLAYLLSEFNKLKIPFIIVHGNHETESRIKKIASKLKYVRFLHKIHHIIEEILFIGYGGGGFEQIDKNLEKVGRKFKRIIKKNKDKKVIMVTHAPPYKTKLDKLGLGSYCGNKSIRKFIEESRVDYLFCGHIHETAGKKDKIKRTIVMNPGFKGKIVNL